MEVICASCNASYVIPEEKVPLKKAAMKCRKCGAKIIVDPGQRRKSAVSELPAALPQKTDKAEREQVMRFKEYKVLHVVEGGCGTLLLGASGIPIKKMEAALNEAVAEGWQVVFQIVEAKRYLLFWTREAVIITLGR